MGCQVNPVSTFQCTPCFLQRTNGMYDTVSKQGLTPFVSCSRFSLIASAGQPKSLVLQREGAVSFIQLFSTSTSVCQGGGKRRLNTLCNSTRPDAVLLRFNVPFFCLCRWKRLAGWGREWTKSRQSQGQGEMKRVRDAETTAPCQVFVTRLKSVVSKGCYVVERENNNNVVDFVFHPVLVVSGENMRLSLFCPCHPCYCGYLLKKEVDWMKSQHVFTLLGDELYVV